MQQGANSKIEFRCHVIKEVIDDEEYDEYLPAAALREAYLQTLARQYYPYIPEVISVSGNRIKMQYLDSAIRLNEYLERHPQHHDLVRRQVEVIITSLSQAMIQHRDITYENLMVDSQGHLWLIDFGRARRVDSARITQASLDDLAIYDDTINDYFRGH